MSERWIQTEAVPHCMLCGSQECRVLYSDLNDRMFGVPGTWSYKKCCRCGLVFLDPRPRPEDIGRAYANYYTHSTTSPAGLVRRIYYYARRGYLAMKFGYGEGTTRWQRLSGNLVYLQPGKHETANASVMYLPAKQRGHLLEIGFGSGKMLAELRRLGWQVEGVDFDHRAVEAARRNYDLAVRAGTLDEQAYPADYFDVVAMSHVIEHLHEPVNLLKECARILKPGGILVLATPNIESHLHSLFRSNWLSLDPPRHLNMFSMQTMSRAASEAGLDLREMRTTVQQADRVLAASLEISANGYFSWKKSLPISRQILGSLYLCLMTLALWRYPNIGEELVMVAVKGE